MDFDALVLEVDLAGIRRVDLAVDRFGGADVRCLTSAYPDVAVSNKLINNFFDSLIFVINLKKQKIKQNFISIFKTKSQN